MNQSREENEKSWCRYRSKFGETRAADDDKYFSSSELVAWIASFSFINKRL